MEIRIGYFGAAAFVITAFVLYQLEGLSVAQIITGAAIAAAITFPIVYSFNPDYVYRRLMAFVVGLVAIVNIGWPNFKASFVSETTSVSIQSDGIIPWSFNLTIGLIFLALAALEAWRMHKSGKKS